MIHINTEGDADVHVDEAIDNGEAVDTDEVNVWRWHC